MDAKILSVIIPIYNVQEYLREALDSVLEQTIGFGENIELILINDGSPDDSEAICLEYKNRFPENIIYIKQENAGVSAARNHGLEIANGKYIAFCDPDDRLSKDAYEKCVEFFENNYACVDLVAFKMKFFEKYTGDHPLNYRFKETKIINIRENPTYMQSSGVSCVFKAEVLTKKRFDTGIKYAEDMKLINEILLDKMAYGVVQEPVYFVRKRMNQSSASNGSAMDPDYYLVTPKEVFEHLFDLWQKTNGVLDEFIQFVILFDIQWRITQRVQTVLTPDREKEYKRMILGLLKRITNDELILGLPNLNKSFKLFLLKKKYGEDTFSKLIHIQDGATYIGEINIDERLGRGAALPYIHIDTITQIKRGEYELEGYIARKLIEDLDYSIRTSKGDFVPTIDSRRSIRIRRYFLGEAVDINQAFVVRIKTREKDEIRALYHANNDISIDINIGKFTTIGNMRHAYNRIGDALFVKTNRGLRLYKATKLKVFGRELVFLLAILSNLKMNVFRIELSNAVRYKLHDDVTILPKRIYMVIRPFFIPLKAFFVNLLTIGLRLAARIARLFKRREIWLISDRISVAEDNGEAFYDYLKEHNVNKYRYYFAINKNSVTYERLQTKGFNLVDMLGLKYKFLALIADKVISSNADDLIFNPFLNQWSRFIDMMEFKSVFLQHGISKDDVSGHFNRWSTGFDMFVTSGKSEYESIVSNDSYGFRDGVVQLTGMPRFDVLRNNPKDKIILMPTWRRGLDGGLDPRTGLRKYSPGFIKTEYYIFYNKLINDTRITDVLKEKGMVGEFYLHPSFAAQAQDFDSNNVFTIQEFPYNFPEVFSEGTVLVTDYSSVAFDFAYLNKPVIYSQFDREEFFNSHTYKEGYFSYKDDGFGPVCDDYEHTVDVLVKLIHSGCSMDEKYKARVKKFFKYNDKENSKRVYTAIEKL